MTSLVIICIMIIVVPIFVWSATCKEDMSPRDASIFAVRSILYWVAPALLAIGLLY